VYWSGDRWVWQEDLEPRFYLHPWITYGGMMFEEFWSQYPKKIAKPVAMKAWNKLSTDDKTKALEALSKHIGYWAETTEKQFIPYPATWLNQQRFYDELDIPEPKKTPQLLAWWTSDSGILAKGRELGIEPRPGETMYQFKDRVAGMVRAA
jgi:hypothetical protein